MSVVGWIVVGVELFLVVVLLFGLGSLEKRIERLESPVLRPRGRR